MKFRFYRYMMTATAIWYVCKYWTLLVIAQQRYKRTVKLVDRLALHNAKESFENAKGLLWL